MNNRPPITAADVPDQWIADVRSVIERTGRTIRCRANNTMIELRQYGTEEWAKLMLPGSGFDFADAEQRDIVVKKLKGQT